MKTVILSLAIFILSTVSLIAGNDNTTIFTNISGNIKECTMVDSQTLQPISKTVYENNNMGLRVAKVVYTWDESIGWISQSRQSYKYDKNNKVTGVTYQLWDSHNRVWKEK